MKRRSTPKLGETPKKLRDAPEQPKRPPETKSAGSPVIDSIRRHYLYYVLAVLGVLGGIYATFSSRSDQDVAVENIPGERSDSSGDMDRKIEKKSFDFQSYTLDPSLGTILERHFKEGNKKNIVYIMDNHPLGNAFDSLTRGADTSGLPVQRCIFHILDEAAQSYVNMGLVHEAFTRYDGLNLEENLRRNLGHMMLLKYADITDFRERYDTLAILAGRSIHGATSLIAAIYGREVVSLFPMDEKQEIESVGVDVRRDLALSIFADGTVPCQHMGFNLPQDVTAAVAEDSIVSGKGNDEMVNCLCATGAKFLTESKRWVSYRSVDASRREVDVALQHPGDVVFIVAGNLHTAEALRLFKERGANYILISPEGMPAQFRDYKNLNRTLPDLERRIKAQCRGRDHSNPKMESYFVKTVEYRQKKIVDVLRDHTIK